MIASDQVNVRQFIAAHQLGFSLLVLFAHALTDKHAFLAAIQAPILCWRSEQGTVHPRDVLDDRGFLAVFCFIFTLARPIIARYLLQPTLHKYGFGPQDASHLAALGWKAVSRGILMLYASGLWYNSPDLLNPQRLFQNWPQSQITHPMQCFFLLRLAFYLHQCLVMVVEPIKDDFLDKFLHHILTCAVVIACCNSRVYALLYGILLTADLADFLLAFVQIQRCLGHRKSLRASLLAFIVVWVLTRHVMFAYLHWTLHRLLPVSGDCELVVAGRMVLDPGASGWEGLACRAQVQPGTVCLARDVKLGLSGISIALQGLFLIWTRDFVRVAVQVHRQCRAGETTRIGASKGS
ncbi:uncharacterized protein BO72DRAFT_527604 [Aspergillus fijiensis CBS 313.89]|uniref:TLC domain-containing protein n=1 Tax=Aspergillus fijiensis CBS 313.89 TaxID=1448319 RepID=A0A8G1RNQ9_9EURO|nr:uncharacterized protein BO72DRAFT_527604 [Aspergillus fijiensis CBS 313.89]RAK77422.1 hypothetical protein BO72DRAFT_527604 [Aspergillus fijiensis CBS 313.89]